MNKLRKKKNEACYSPNNTNKVKKIKIHTYIDKLERAKLIRF